MTNNASRRRAKPVIEEKKRGLKMGLGKLYALPSDGAFDDLLRRIARAEKK